MNTLNEYEKKRDFTATPEPKEDVKSIQSHKLIFVIQKHDATRLHFDFRLEYKGVLLSWAIPKGLPEASADKRLAIQTEDHPLSYAKFHGTIPKGQYGAGTVEIWDSGNYVNITVKDNKVIELSDAIEKGHFSVYCVGNLINGTYSFTRTDGKKWIVVKKVEERKNLSNYLLNKYPLITLTNLEKELDEGIYKKHLVEYYSKIAPFMLQHIKDRPISMLRFPNGIKGKKFFQKNAPAFFKLECKKITHKDGETCYPIVKTEGDIVYLGNQVVETHVMTSHFPDIDKPDKIIFDLDPSIQDLKALKSLAIELKKIMAGIGLSPFIMATGGKGYHVFAPIFPESPHNEVRDFALKIADLLAQSNPRIYTTELIKEKRKERIFIDVNRNSPMQTSIAPYSARAIKGFPIACPFEWDELVNTNPDTFTIFTPPQRDALKDFEEKKVSLQKIIAKLKES
jgi:bifunctional non-homologous end joining protein LigD